MTSVHPPFDTRIFHKQAKSLLKAGYGVTLIAQHERDEVVDGVKIMALPKPRNRFWRILGTCRVFRLVLKQKADIYHFHDPELIPAATLIKLIKRKRLIYDIHEDIPKQILTKPWLPRYLRAFISKLFAFVERVTFPLFDAVIAASEDITLHLPRSPKLVVIKNFTSIEVARQSQRKHAKERKGRRATLIYVGGLNKDRGAREMVKAVSLLGDKAKLVLVGTFSDPFLEDELRAEAGKEVEFIGQVPYEKVFSFLSDADMGLVCFQPTPNNIAASWRNNKLFEYMAAGLPVIASNFPLWQDFVEGNKCGLTVDPLNPAKIAEAAEYLIEHPDEAKKMGENGKRAVAEKYNWETESQKLIGLYKNLLKGSQKTNENMDA
jgi:glycosyltransferase involved in cell wall biosynthesis